MSENREELESRIAAYIDGQLPPAEAARLEVFLANTDPRLAEEIIGMLADRHHLRSLPRTAAPPDLAGRIMDQIERSTLLNDAGHLEHQARPWWQSRAVIAAGFTLLIGGFAVFVAKVVLGPTPDNKWSHVALNPPTNSPVASAPTLDHSLAAGPMPALPAGPEYYAPATRNASVPQPLASAQADKKIPDNLAKSITPAAPPAILLPETHPEPDAKTETALAAQLERNSVVLNGGQIAAAKMGYATVNSPIRALANISAANNTLAAEPVILTLVARNDQDFSRLRNTLKDIMLQDPVAAQRQSALHRRYAEFVITNAANNTLRFGGDNQLAVDNVQSKEEQRTADKARALNDESAKDAEAKTSAAEKKAPAAANAPIMNQLNFAGGKGGATTTNAAQNTMNKTMNNTLAYKFYSPKRNTFEDAADADAQTKAGNYSIDQLRQNNPKAGASAAPVAAASQPAAPGAATPEAGASGQLQAANNASQHGQAQQIPNQILQQIPQQISANGIAQAPPAVYYRVALRPRQLEQLTREFQVDSITSGRQAFVITPETDDRPPRPVAQTQQLADENRREQPPAEPQQKLAQKMPAEQKIAPLSSAVPAPAATSPSATPASNSSWVECIITMQQSPATSAPAEK